jgi:hypothetical protein
MEFVGKSLPPLSIKHWDETSPTHRIKKATEDLENLLDAPNWSISSPDLLAQLVALNF